MFTIQRIASDAPGIASILELMGSASHAVALTGAGISVESGIPDFRSPGGLWEIFSPDEYATYQVFESEPEKAWRLFRAIEAKILPARPNPAHEALARLEEAGILKALITQNIDGLHQAAGSKRVWEIHGDHQRLHCPECDTVRTKRPGDFDAPESREERGQTDYPRCERCDHALKPNVVLFGEAVRDLENIVAELEPCDLLIVVGTSAQVAPSSNFPHAVKHRGGKVLEFNDEPTVLSGKEEGGLQWLVHSQPMGGPVTDYLVLGKAGETLPAVADLLQPSPSPIQRSDPFEPH